MSMASIYRIAKRSSVKKLNTIQDVKERIHHYNRNEKFDCKSESSLLVSQALNTKVIMDFGDLPLCQYPPKKQQNWIK